MARPFADIVRETVNGAPGTGNTVTLGGAVAGFRTFAQALAAGHLVDGQVVHCVLESNYVSGLATRRETSAFTYDQATSQLLGRTALSSNNGGAVINASSDAQVFLAILSQYGREPLTADANYYVDNAAGDNSNPGTQAEPFETLQYAWDYLSGVLDLGQYTLSINLAASATPYTLSTENGWVGGAKIKVIGDSSATTTIGKFEVEFSDGPLSVVVNGVTMKNLDGVCAFFGSPGHELRLGDLETTPDIVLDATGGNEGVLRAASGGKIRVDVGTLTIALPANIQSLADANGAGTVVDFDEVVCTLDGVTAFSAGAVEAYNGALVIFEGATFDGDAPTGKRFIAEAGSVLAGNGDLGILPGDQPGSLVDGGVYIGVAPRTVLLADASYYVDNTTGDNSNPGTEAEPFATLQYAWEHLAGTLDLSQYELTINLAASATPYTLATAVGWIGGSQVLIRGDSSATTTVSEFGVEVPYGLQYYLIDGVTFTSSVYWGSPTRTLNIGDSPGDIAFDLTGASRMLIVDAGARLNLDVTAVTITLPASFASLADCSGAGSFISFGGGTVTLDGVTNFTAAAAKVSTQGLIECGATFDGDAATGPRFSGESEGIFDCGGDAEIFPGDEPGTLDSGAQYLGLLSFDGSVVADLPDAAIFPQGTRTFVTNSNATLAAGPGNVVAGGGANRVPVYADDGDWRIG